MPPDPMRPTGYIPMRNAIPSQYFVIFHDDALGGAELEVVADQLLHGEPGTSRRHLYRQVMLGFACKMSDARAHLIANDPRVAYVQQDSWLDLGLVAEPVPIINPPLPWNLDRIDERLLDDLDGTYLHETTGEGVNVYIIDSGIRATHDQFQGRVANGHSVMNDNHGTDDGHPQGHGTHVAGIVGAVDCGVAKRATLRPVRVFAWGAANPAATDVVAGIEWVMGHRIKPAVANLSTVDWANAALDTAVKRLIEEGGVACVVAAGNDDGLASLRSPARVAKAITVSATNDDDERAERANFGQDVDLFAPGSNITSTGNGGDHQTYPLSGTSTAAPHVTGVAARYLQNNRNATPGQVYNYLKHWWTQGQLVLAPAENSPNRLVYADPAE